MLLIFDWDGTLSNSTAKIVECLRIASNEAGLSELDSSVYQDIIGLGLPEALYKLYPDISETDYEAMRAAYVRAFLADDQTPSPLFEGVETGLNVLKKAGYSLAVATGKSRKGLNRVLNDLEFTELFHASRCADETKSKPHPLMLEELLAHFAKPHHQALMVGDTEYDMAMAESIDMPRVAVSYGAHHISRLQAFNPVLNVDHFDEFVDWVLQNHPISS